jgi:uncharacterized protein YndB with AHSA1/START domain
VEGAHRTGIHSAILVEHNAAIRVETGRVVEDFDARRRRSRQREVVEIEPHCRLVLRWRNEFRPELKAEGYSRLTYQLEKEGNSVKLAVIHEMEKEGSKLIEAVSSGWPHILASLKSLLETGESLEATREWPQEARN